MKLFGVLGLLICLALAAVMGAAAGCGGGSGSTALENCAAGCPSSWIGNGQCESACRNAACEWDGGDCAWVDACAVGCPDEWIGDGVCDDSCYNAACSWDGGDCDITECPAGSSPAVNDPGMCCEAGYPYYWPSDGMCYTALPYTVPTPTPTQSYQCPAGSSFAINDHTRCCPSGYPYYWSTDGNCHTAAWSAPTPTPAPACSTGYFQAVNNPSKCCPSGFPYYWDTDGMCHTAALPEWREDIRSGDILLSPTGAMNWGHVGICYGTDYVIEAISAGVSKTPIEEWYDKPGLYVLRVACSNNIADQAADLALQQLGKAYQYNFLSPSSALNSSYWYCSELVWAVYMNVGINLEYTPDIGPVTPWEIYMTTQVIYHAGPPDIIPD